MLMEIRDDVIWGRHLKDSPELYEAVLRMDQNDVIKLSVDGIVSD